MPAHRVGIGFRPALAAAMLSAPSRFDFIEVVAESCQEKIARREAIAMAELWPAIPHGVKMSLGSAEGIDDASGDAVLHLKDSRPAVLVPEAVATKASEAAPSLAAVVQKSRGLDLRGGSSLKWTVLATLGGLVASVVAVSLAVVWRRTRIDRRP